MRQSLSKERFGAVRRHAVGPQAIVDSDGTVILSFTAHDGFQIEDTSVVVGGPVRRAPGRVVAQADTLHPDALVAALVRLPDVPLRNECLRATVHVGALAIVPSRIEIARGPSPGVSILRAWVDANEQNLVVGGVVRVSLFTETPLVAVASSALVGRNHLGPAVFVQIDSAESRFDRRRVHPGAQHDDKITILAGLAPGDRVIVRGAHVLESAVVEFASRQRRG